MYSLLVPLANLSEEFQSSSGCDVDGQIQFLPPNIPAPILFLLWFVQSFMPLHSSAFLNALVWIIFPNDLTGSVDAFQGCIWELHVIVACHATLWLSDWHFIAVSVSSSSSSICFHSFHSPSYMAVQFHVHHHLLHGLLPVSSVF